MKKYILIMFLTFNCLGFSQNSTNELSDIQILPSVSGFYNRVSIGVLGGSNSSPSFNIVNGYRFNQNLSAGFGLGAEQFFGRGYTPLFLEGEYKLLKSNTSPFLSIMSGYELPMRNFGDDKGGFTCGGKVGFDFFINNHIGISTSAGYRFASLRDFSNWGGWDDFVTIRKLNRYEFRVGIVFK